MEYKNRECPILEKTISFYDCYDMAMAAEGMGPPDFLGTEEPKELARRKKICLACPNHIGD